MKREYAYFPGCTLETTSCSYDVSTRACAGIMSVALKEMPDWNCCGATAGYVVDDLLAKTINARNLAIGERLGCDITVPCSACFKNLYTTRKYLTEDNTLKRRVNTALKEDNLEFKGTSRVRHFLDICINDVGLDTIRAMVKKPLTGLKVATYYGCQIVRPENDFDDAENPVLFEKLIGALGATATEYTLKTKCCGAALIITKNEAALRMLKKLLRSAVDSGADLIAAACPLCQLNLDAYQKAVNKAFNTNFNIPILYFTQLMGLAFGISKDKLGIGKEFVGAGDVIGRIL